MGFVLPTAIDKKITFKFRRNGTEQSCEIYSAEFDKTMTADLHNISPSTTSWENYVLGVLNEIKQRTDNLRGFDCIMESNVPAGSGVSSSAALECGLAFGLNELFDLGLSKLEIGCPLPKSRTFLCGHTMRNYGPVCIRNEQGGQCYFTRLQ